MRVRNQGPGDVVVRYCGRRLRVLDGEEADVSEDAADRLKQERGIVVVGADTAKPKVRKKSAPQKVSLEEGQGTELGADSDPE